MDSAINEWRTEIALGIRKKYAYYVHYIYCAEDDNELNTFIDSPMLSIRDEEPDTVSVYHLVYVYARSDNDADLTIKAYGENNLVDGWKLKFTQYITDNSGYAVLEPREEDIVTIAHIRPY